MTLMLIIVVWKSTSSNGWEYLIMWGDLDSSPMYAIMCYLIDYCFNNMFDHDEW